MTDFLMWAGGIVVTGLFSLVGWVIGMIFGKIRDHETIHTVIDKKIDDHRLHVAENYTPRDYIEKMEGRLVSHLVRIEDKLDKKADK